MDFIGLCKETWNDCGLSGLPPADVAKAQSMHKRVVDWVNEAYVHVQQLHYNWGWLWNLRKVQLVAGKNEYTETELGITDFGYLIRLSLAGTQNATKWSPLRLVGYDPLIPHTTGTPGGFSIKPTGDWVFDRLPDKIYWAAFEYYRSAQRLVTNFDTPLVPLEFQHIIVHRAKISYALFDEDSSGYEEATNSYKSTLVRMESQWLPPVNWPVNPFTGD